MVDVDSPVATADTRNMLSWRVPNEPSPKMNSIGQEIKSPKVSNTNLTTPSTKKKSQDVGCGTKDRLAESSVKTCFSDNPSITKIWKLLFASLNRSVDELYNVCDEEGSINRCLETIELLDNSKLDFSKLIQKIESQKSFSVGRNKSVSWEIRTKKVMLSESKLNAAAVPFNPTEV